MQPQHQVQQEKHLVVKKKLLRPAGDGLPTSKVVKKSGAKLEHACGECGKKYSTSSNLARHKQTHR